VGSPKLPGGRWLVFATKLALQANPAKNTKAGKNKIRVNQRNPRLKILFVPSW
jgi:hypothetical protein